MVGLRSQISSSLSSSFNLDISSVDFGEVSTSVVFGILRRDNLGEGDPEYVKARLLPSVCPVSASPELM